MKNNDNLRKIYELKLCILTLCELTKWLGSREFAAPCR